MEDWALIRHLYLAEGLSQRRIAEKLSLSRNTVARAVASSTPPRYERAPAANAFDAVEQKVRTLLKEYPRMPATVIAERVGWQGSISWFRENVQRLRPEYAPKDPADRLDYAPGDQIQCDLWFPPARIPLNERSSGSPPVLVMVASWSRFISARMLPSRTTGDLLLGMWCLLSLSFGAVPKRLLWDNEAGIGRRGRLSDGVAGFCGTLGTKIVQVPPFDPESKGIVERANGYLETSFMPGRSFASPADFNHQLSKWLSIANTRRPRARPASPAELIDTDRRAMLALPPLAPLFGRRVCQRLGRDYYARVMGNDYSLDPVAIGAMVEIVWDLDSVRAWAGAVPVANHERAWGSGSVITDPAHRASAQRMRRALREPLPEPPGDPAISLSAYDRHFGVEEGQWETR